MQTERWQRVELIYNEALDVDPGRRARFVAQECGGDASLEEEVISLLEEADRDASFLEAPAMQMAAMSLAASAGPDGQISGAPAHPEFIGHYRVIRLLGEGGMGTVYEAEQEQPRRTVALKVIRPGLATAERLRRFKHESQALGRLQHPGIAQIYEANTADTGFGPQPYFAMELVRGISLDRYAAEHPLTLRQKLELMAKICEAVQHAHQRGLIHRDLKPGNILIDESAQPRILDFGVARIAEDAAQTTMQTEAGQIVGTLAYMSPEQVLGDPLEVDHRSDVYSLGVILYELLSGHSPYNVSSRQFHEALQIIREEDPAPLSSVSRIYRGDVETIVGKALEKDKTRRYESAAALAADIQRYLGDEPILARPPSAGYQLQKFARRHRALVSGVAAVIVVLVIGIATSSWLAIRASRAGELAIAERDRAVQAEARARSERDRATAAEQAANRERDRAEAAQGLAVLQQNLALAEKRRADEQAATAVVESNFLEKDLLAQAGARAQIRAGTKPDPDLKVRTALDRASARIDGKFDQQPLVEASIRQTIGNAYRAVGAYPEAQRHLERAIELRRKALGERNPDTLISLRDLASLYASQGKWAQAESLYSQVLAEQEALLGKEHRETVETRYELAIVYDSEEKSQQAEAGMKQVLQAQRRILGPENMDTLETENRLGLVYLKLDDYAQAEPLLTQALAAQQRTLGPDHPDTLLSLHGLASLYWKQGKYAQAEPLLTKALAVQTRELGEDDRETLYGMNSLAFLYNLEGKYPQCEELFARALNAERRLLGPEHSDTLSTMQNLAAAFHEDGKFEMAEPLAKETLAIRRRMLGEENPETLSSTNNLASIYFSEGRYADAEPLFTKVLEIRQRTVGPEARATLLSMNNLSEIDQRLGKYADAEALATRTLEIRSRKLGAEERDTLVSMNVLGDLYRLQGRFAQANDLLTRSLEVRRRVLGPEHPETLGNLSDLAALRRDEGNTAEAASLFASVLEARRRVLGPTNPDTLEAMVSLAELRVEQKRFADAEPLLREALAAFEKTAPDSWLRFHSQSLLGESLSAQGRFAEAEPLLIEGYKGIIRQAASVPFENRPEISRAEAAIPELYAKWGKPEKAEEWHAQLEQH